MAKKISNKTAHLKKVFLLALENSLGVVTSACKNAGVSRTTFYRWYAADEAFKAECNDMKDVALDFAESRLYQRMKDGSDAAIIFYLKTQGKKRGYIERSEIEVTNTQAFVVKEEHKGVAKVMDVIHKKTGTNDKS